NEMNINTSENENKENKKALIRLFVLERPGIGLLTFVKRNFIDFLNDIKEFCQQKSKPDDNENSPALSKAAFISSVTLYNAPNFTNTMDWKLKFDCILELYFRGQQETECWEYSLWEKNWRVNLNDIGKEKLDVSCESCFVEKLRYMVYFTTWNKIIDWCIADNNPN
ncbi:30219_t:CDS:2, partial [Gigaspora margarita]